MAHAATLAGLAEGLVTAVTGRTIDEPGFRMLKDRAVKRLRDRSHARTNQYAVEDKLNGLVEKFTVLNRDDLAEALEYRLQKLSTSSGWVPELLSLLSNLSDQPALKTVLLNVQNACEVDASAQQSDWKDVLALDAESDVSVWETVSRGYHSSGDDEYEEDVNLTVSSKATSIEETSLTDLARLHLQTINNDELTAVERAYHLWDGAIASPSSLQVSELVVTRDLLSMLHGLPTDIFQKDVATGRTTVARRVYISKVSHSSLLSVLTSAGDVGTTLNALRFWTIDPQEVPYIQSVQAEVQKLLSGFAQLLAGIEQSIISPSEITTLSISEVLTLTTSAARTLVELTSLIQGCPSVELLPFGLLDVFYEAMTVAQLAGDMSLYSTLLPIFLSGFTTYLRPVFTWITTGTIDANGQDEFLVKEVNENCARESVWHARFDMRDAQFIPKCMQAAAGRVFALGKSQSFLRSLGCSEAEPSPLCDGMFTLTSFEETLGARSFMPVAQGLGDAIDSWLTLLTPDRTDLLSSMILYEYGLIDVMTALPSLYFARDGSRFHAFAESLAKHMEPSSAGTSDDQFLLTELAHDAFEGQSGVELENIYLYVTGYKKTTTTLGKTQRLGHVNLRYSLPWPVQNITRCSTPKVHAQVLSLLLQLHYSTSLLSRFIFELRPGRRHNGESLRLRQRIQCFNAIVHSFLTLNAHNIHQDIQQKLQGASGIDEMVAAWAEYESLLQHRLLVAPRYEPLRQSILRILVISELVSASLTSDRVRELRGQFDKEVRFLTTGLRSTNGSGIRVLEMLAERLTWSLL